MKAVSGRWHRQVFLLSIAFTLSGASFLDAGLAQARDLDYFVPVNFRNGQVEKFVAPTYSQSDLKKLKRFLTEKGTLDLRRYSSGGHSAVTIGTDRSLESAISGLLIMHWDRDNIMQALAEREDGLSQWHSGLKASLKHHYRYRHRFIDMIEGKSDKKSQMQRPHIRYNAVSLDELSEPWGHAQNDALSFITFLLFFDALESNRSIDGQEALAYAVLLPHYLDAVKVEHDLEMGAWEDKRAVHASSLLVVLAALRQEYEYVTRHGTITAKIDGREYRVDEAFLRQLLLRVKKSLKTILPNEYVESDQNDTRADKSKVRKFDSALVNGLLLGALSANGIISDKMTATVLAGLEANLMGADGVARYPHDIWDGRTDRHDLKRGQEAQWCHVSPLMSVVYGDLYRRTGHKVYFDKQTEHFNRALSHINERYAIPEAYIVEPPGAGKAGSNAKEKTKVNWIADANEPLAWGQAALRLAFNGMEKSLVHSADLKKTHK